MRTSIVAATAALLLATAGIVVGEQAANADADRVLRARETITGLFPQDLGAKGLTPGDGVTFTTKVRDMRGRPLGDSGGQCALMSGHTEATSVYHCTQTYRLGHDQLIVAGVLDFNLSDNTWAVLGGTGRYRDAHGQVTFTVPKGNTFQDVFRFDS